MRPPLRSLLPALALLASTPALADDRLKLAELPAPEALTRLLWTRSPELLEQRARIATADAAALKAGLLPNPGLDLALATLPIGPTNPEGLNRVADVPNASVGVSALFEVGKRGPRREAARASARANRYEAADALRLALLDLYEAVGRVAASERRIAALDALAKDADESARLQHQRAERGDTAGLDADRAELEAESLRSKRAEQERALADALLSCGRVAGLPCEPFGSADAASAFLASHAAMKPAAAPVDARADLKSLAEAEASARHQLDLAHAQKIPDPTVRAGYVRDQFVVSGNQQNSLFVGLSLPLPVFDRGQAEAAQAEAALEAARAEQRVKRERAEADRLALQSRAEALGARRERMAKETLPLARRVVERLAAAVQAGGAPLQDLLLARRTLGELLLDSADLDLAALELALDLRRVSAELPPLPFELPETTGAQP